MSEYLILRGTSDAVNVTEQAEGGEKVDATFDPTTNLRGSSHRPGAGSHRVQEVYHSLVLVHCPEETVPHTVL